MADRPDTERIDDLEVRLTFIDETVTGLSAADAEQSMRLRALEQALQDIRHELRAIRTSMGHDARDEPPPPHY